MSYSRQQAYSPSSITDINYTYIPYLQETISHPFPESTYNLGQVGGLLAPLLLEEELP